MSDTLLIALLSFLGTVLGSLLGILAANRLTNYRIAQLEKKVETHNKVIDRVYKLEKHDAVINEEITVANHRISDLEKAIPHN